MDIGAATLTSRQSCKAMGVTCTATVMGSRAPIIASTCLDMVRELELLWSRFVPSSDICRLNERAGTPTLVDARTASLIAHMIAGFRDTAGLFNPTRLPEQLAMGDDRSLIDERTSSVPPWAAASDSLESIEFLDDSRVLLPRGMTLDAGGIGKGRAADLVAQHALDLGADSACINLGGDMMITGPSPDGTDWTVDVLDPLDMLTPISSVVVARGGVATSSVAARNRGPHGIANHIMGGSTTSGTPHGRPRVIGATVLASTATWAEVWTKHAILAPVERTVAELEQRGLAGLLVGADGSSIETRQWKDFQP